MNETMEGVLNESQVRTHRNLYFAIKRTFDILVGLLGLIVLIPLTIIIKIAYLITGDKAPIFYKQKRIGMNGQAIYIYKFRSMVPNADVVLKKLLKQKKYREEWEANQKLDNDPRITKIGKFIRATSIDEVPQFLNVLKGDMSLIGPRPLVEGELDAHKGNHEIYESVRPGITGWWACSGRSALDYDERLKLEYFYAENACLSLDIKCIFKTIKAVIKKSGAK